jgi:cyanophycin synthetase
MRVGDGNLVQLGYGKNRRLIEAAVSCRTSAIACGIPREKVAASIAGFRSVLHNPGRANIFRVGAGYVMIDYGHNPDAFESVARMATTWKGQRVTAITGVPGDRGDGLIAHAGRVAARGFERIVIKEDHDLRGRAPGEVAELLAQAVKDEAPDRECLIAEDECQALRRELERLGYGEVVVMFYDKLEPVLETLKEFDAVAVSEIEGLAPQLSFMRV